MRLKNALLGAMMFSAMAGLEGCSSFQQDPQTAHEAICKELNYRMTNYSSVMTNQDDVSNPNNSQFAGWQQTADMDKLQKNYHDRGCD